MDTSNETTKPDLKKLIQEYLEAANMMQLATISNNKPWICNMWFAADKNMNLYWFSSNTTRHSKELTDNPQVAIAVCLPQNPSDNSARGIQLEGIAEMLTNQEDIDTAIENCVGRIFSIEQIKKFMSDTYEPHRFYRVKPTMIVLVDTVNFPDSPVQRYIPTINS